MDRRRNGFRSCSERLLLQAEKVEKGLVVINENDANVVLSARNLPTINTTLTSTLNVYDVMKAGTVVLTKDAVKTIEEVYA